MQEFSTFSCLILWFAIFTSGHADSRRKYSKSPQNNTTQYVEEISYRSMPELFALDHYESCMSRPGWAYCVLDIELANVPGDLYDYIVEYSSYTKQHFNRTRLHRGVCVSERCGMRGSLEQNQQPAHYQAELLACLNMTIWQQHRLQVGRVKILNCNSVDEIVPPPDALDYAVGGIVAVLIIFAACGSIHHVMMSAGVVTENRYVMTFSVIRNWEVMLKSRGTSESTDTFQCLQGMRFLTMVILTSIHVGLFMTLGFIENPQFIEMIYDDPLQQWILNGIMVVQTFFAISGFLLAHQTLRDMDRRKLSFTYILVSIFKRYIRILLPELVIMGLMSTWVPRMGSGPLWNVLVRKEQTVCRTNWWKQVAFIQNYYTLESICLLQTWHLAADLQLHVIGLLVLGLVVYSGRRWRGCLLLSTVLGASLSVSALQTYIFNLMPKRVIMFPEALHTRWEGNISYFYGYESPQANWAGFTLGMMTGYLHHQAQVNHLDLRNSVVLKVLYYMSLPVALLSLWVGSDFHTRDATRLEAVLFNTLDHNVFAAAMCVFILGCIYKCNRVFAASVEWVVWQPLGRLTYCAFLAHIAVLQTYTGHVTEMHHGSYYTVVSVTLATTVISYLVAVPLFLLVEQPSYNLQKIFFSSNKSSAFAKPSQLNGHAQPKKQNV